MQDSPLHARPPSLFKDPWSAATHFAGLIGAIVALPFLLHYAQGATRVTGMAIYGMSLVLLFFASTLYHFVDLGERRNKWLQRFDHVAIYLLIAGTYLPALMHLLDGAWRIGMLTAVGVLTVAGILFKLVWIECPDWIGTAQYLALGWVAVIPAPIILPLMDWTQMAWLFGGGMAYSLGALVFVFKRPDPWPDVFGHHEVWHLFVLLGAAMHYAFTFTLIDTPLPPF